MIVDGLGLYLGLYSGEGKRRRYAVKGPAPDGGPT